MCVSVRVRAACGVLFLRTCDYILSEHWINALPNNRRFYLFVVFRFDNVKR